MHEIDKPYDIIDWFTVVRNPMDRVVSMYHECKRSNHRRTETFDDWLDRIEEEGFYNPHASLMCHFLKPFMELFPLLQIHDMDVFLKNETVQLNATLAGKHEPTYEQQKRIKNLFKTDFLLYDEIIIRDDYHSSIGE